MTEPVTVSAERTTRAQRRKIRGLGGLLGDDLYKRDGEDPQFPGLSARWVSPLGWAVTYGGMLDGERVWVRIYDPEGARYAETDDGDEDWLHGTLP